MPSIKYKILRMEASHDTFENVGMLSFHCTDMDTLAWLQEVLRLESGVTLAPNQTQFPKENKSRYYQHRYVFRAKFEFKRDVTEYKWKRQYNELYWGLVKLLCENGWEPKGKGQFVQEYEEQ